MSDHPFTKYSMDKDKLTQEELVSSLTTWKALADIAVKLDGYYKDKEEQAYTQIKEIVETWYKYNLWDLKTGVVE